MSKTKRIILIIAIALIGITSGFICFQSIFFLFFLGFFFLDYLMVFLLFSTSIITLTVIPTFIYQIGLIRKEKAADSIYIDDDLIQTNSTKKNKPNRVLKFFSYLFSISTICVGAVFLYILNRNSIRDIDAFILGNLILVTTIFTGYVILKDNIKQVKNENSSTN